MRAAAELVWKMLPRSDQCDDDEVHLRLNTKGISRNTEWRREKPEWNTDTIHIRQKLHPTYAGNMRQSVWDGDRKLESKRRLFEFHACNRQVSGNCSGTAARDVFSEAYHATSVY